MKTSDFAATAFILGVLIPSCVCAPKPPPPLEQADAIFLGRQIGQSPAEGGISLEFAVDVSLYGNLPDGSQVTAFDQDSPSREERYRPPSSKQYVFFLQLAGTQYRLMPVDCEYYHFERGLLVPTNFNARSLADSSADKRSKILTIVEAHLLLTHGSYSSAKASVRFLGDNPGTETAAFIAKLSRGGEPCLTVAGIVATILAGDFSALSSFGKSVPFHSSCPGEISLPPAFDLVTAADIDKIRQMGAFYLSGKEAREKSGNLTSADDGALAALARVHTRETIPYLLSALIGDDPINYGAATAGLWAFIKSQPPGTLNSEASDALSKTPTPILGRPNSSWEVVLSLWKLWYQENLKMFADLPSPNFDGLSLR